jgi:HSP20 family molecular chaperone IbpA
MPFFAQPAFFRPAAAEVSFNPLLQLLSEIDSASCESEQCSPTARRAYRRHVRTFNPKFDVHETESTYELHGELPGIERENVTIEFSDPQTIVIKGRVERAYTNAGPAADAVEAAPESETLDETAADEDFDMVEPAAQHKATVEDEAAQEAHESGTDSLAPEAAADPEKTEAVAEKAPTDKYWVTERSVGQFLRSFNFQARVEQEGVTANLSNGILSVSVPKAKKHEIRRVAVY